MHCDEVCREIVDGEHAAPLAQLRGEYAAMRAAVAAHQETLRAISDEIAERYQEQIDAAIASINELRAEFAERASEVLSAINEDLEANAPDPDQVDWPTADEADVIEADDMLFDSKRGYLEQMDFYKRYQRKPTGVA